MERMTIEKAAAVAGAYMQTVDEEGSGLLAIAAEIDKLIDAAVSDALAEQQTQYEALKADYDCAVRQMNTYSEQKREAESRHAADKQKARLEAQAEMRASLEKGYRGEAGVWPNWINEASLYRRHQEEQTPWLDDLLAALNWKGGSVHDALNCVRRLIHADLDKQKAVEEALAAEEKRHVSNVCFISNERDEMLLVAGRHRDAADKLKKELAAERLRGEQALSACQSGVEERIEAAVRSEREACAKVADAEWRMLAGDPAMFLVSRIANNIRVRSKDSPTDLPAPPADTETGVAMISAERQRQIDKEGWTPEHDDQHTKGELAEAAACYATARPYVISCFWPWDKSWWKPSSPIRNLVKAGALIAAEIDRLHRAKSPAPPRSIDGEAERIRQEERQKAIAIAYRHKDVWVSQQSFQKACACRDVAREIEGKKPFDPNFEPATVAYDASAGAMDEAFRQFVDGRTLAHPAPPDSKPTPQKRHDCLPLHNGSADECDYCRHLGNAAYHPWEHGKFVESGWVPVPFVVGQF